MREIVFGWWTSMDRERSKKWEPDRKERIYRSSVKLDRFRYREVSRQLSGKVSRKWSSTDTSIEEVSRNSPSNVRTEARSIHQLSRSYRGGMSFLDLSTKYWEAVGNVIKKKLKKLDRQQGIEEVSSQLLKPVFWDVKNIDMNAIQHATQPMIQSTY